MDENCTRMNERQKGRPDPICMTPFVMTLA